ITFLLPISHALRYPHSFPTRRSSDLEICTICICLWEMKKHSHFVSLYGRPRESKLADQVAQFLLPVRSTSWPILRLEMLFAYALIAATITQTLYSTTTGYKNKDLTCRKSVWSRCKISHTGCLIPGEQRQRGAYNFFREKREGVASTFAPTASLRIIVL